MICRDNSLSAATLAKRIGIIPKAVEKHIAKMKTEGILKRIGPDKDGHWQVVEKRIDFSGGTQFSVCKCRISSLKMIHANR